MPGRITAISAVVLATLLAPLGSRALPPNRFIAMQAGDIKYERAALGSWKVKSQDPEIVKARFFDTGEVFLEAGKPGQTIITLENRVISRFWVWQVRVEHQATAPHRPDPSVLSESCGCGSSGKYPVDCLMESPDCVEAMRNLLEAGDLEVADVRVRYKIKGIQVLLKQMQTRLVEAGFAGVELAFVGANLQVKAVVADLAERRKLLLEIYRLMIGKLIIDDEITVRDKAKKD